MAISFFPANAVRKLKFSVLEIIEKLQTGAADADFQKAAAQIYPYVIVQKRIPGFVSLRPRGRGTMDLSKRRIEPPSLDNDWREDWPCGNEIMAVSRPGRRRKRCKNLPLVFSPGS
jgi:hypothetical protein